MASNDNRITQRYCSGATATVVGIAFTVTVVGIVNVADTREMRGRQSATINAAYRRCEVESSGHDRQNLRLRLARYVWFWVG